MPLLSGLLGLPSDDDLVEAELEAPLPANDQRQDYVRAKLARAVDGSYRVSAFPKQDSSMQRTFAEAGGLIVREPFAPAVKEGSLVRVLPLDF